MSVLEVALANGLALARGRRVPFVLTYHGLGVETQADDPSGLMTTPDAFEAQLEALGAWGYRLVGVAELWEAVARGGRAADGLGAITFDDGLADSVHLAADVCAAHGAVLTAFLAPGLFGGDHPDLPPGRRILRAAEVPELVARGVEVGAHSFSHADLTTLTRAQQRDELLRSRAVLEELTGAPVTTMAYPYGNYDAKTIAVARECGYAIACANSAMGPWSALELPREPVYPATTQRRLQAKVAGVYGPVHAAKHLSNLLPR